MLKRILLARKTQLLKDLGEQVMKHAVIESLHKEGCVQVVKKNKNYYMCEECNMRYEDNQLAEKCEAFCKKHKSCSLEITKHAIK